MCSEPAELPNGFRAVVGIASGSVAPDAEHAKDGAAAEMHQSQAVDLRQLVRATVVGHGDEESQQEYRRRVSRRGEFRRQQRVGNVAAQPGEINSQTHAEAVVVGGAIGETFEIIGAGEEQMHAAAARGKSHLDVDVDVGVRQMSNAAKLKPQKECKKRKKKKKVLVMISHVGRRSLIVITFLIPPTNCKTANLVLVCTCRPRLSS